MQGVQDLNSAAGFYFVEVITVIGTITHYPLTIHYFSKYFLHFENFDEDTILDICCMGPKGNKRARTKKAVSDLFY